MKAGRKAGLTPKMKAWAELVVSGVAPADAALRVGYSSGSAANTASMLGRREDVREYMAKLRKEKGGDVDAVEGGRQYLKDRYETPLEMLLDVMNNPKAPSGLRYSAAKDALPYVHAKIGELGKKEKKQKDMEDNAEGKRGPGRPSLPQPRAPLRAVK